MLISIYSIISFYESLNFPLKSPEIINASVGFVSISANSCYKLYFFLFISKGKQQLTKTSAKLLIKILDINAALLVLFSLSLQALFSIF